EAGRRHLEPLVERLDEEGGVGLAVDLSVAAEELEEAVGLGAAVAEDDGLGALGPEPREVLAKAPDVAVEGGLRSRRERQPFFALAGERAEEELRALLQ